MTNFDICQEAFDAQLPPEEHEFLCSLCDNEPMENMELCKDCRIEELETGIKEVAIYNSKNLGLINVGKRLRRLL